FPKSAVTISVPVEVARNIKSAAEYIKYFYIRK
ncbi:unnamed protein product, partial [marine sediment metagenome]